jgi:hypothetical protein
MTEPPAFFAATEHGLEPDPAAASPWSAAVLHGRLIAGLFARAVERDRSTSTLIPVRLTVDLFRPAAMAPVHVETAIVRDGGRLRLVEATATVGNRDVARASVLLLAPSEALLDDAPAPVAWDAPAPDAAAGSRPGLPFDMQPVPGRGVGAVGPRQVWFREHRRLVDGERLTPFVRAALVADMASPVANSSSAGLDYINSDVTLYLGRLPRGEWLGLEATGRVVGDGVTAAQCRLHDVDGVVGWSSMGSLRNPRMRPRLMDAAVDE